MNPEEKSPQQAGRESVAQIPQLYAVDEVCDALSMGRTWVYEQIKTGRIKALKLGRRTLISDAELRRVIADAVQS